MSTKDNPRILIIDDEKQIREAVSSWFTRQGFTVRVGVNGERAVAMCEEEEPDVLLIDMEMPVMNGADAVKKIRPMYPNMPIIVFTGFSESISEVVELGATQILHKPVSLRDLEREVRKCLEEA